MITSRANPRVRRWASLARDPGLRRKEGRALIEGPHLVAELLRAGHEPLALLASKSALARPEIRELIAGREPVLLSDAVFRAIAEARTPQGIAAELAIPRRAGGGDRVFLEGVQDPGNVGAIIRSAAAFGAGEVVLDAACADPWSPRALRGGMGAHFRLAIRQVAGLDAALRDFEGMLVVALPRGGTPLRQAALRGRLGWIFGGEGGGASEAVARRAALAVTIPMAAGAESLNVAAAAAVCLCEAFSRRAGGS